MHKAHRLLRGGAHGAAPSWWRDSIVLLAPMQAAGIVEVAGSTVRLTRRGAPLARIVASAFDAYLRTSVARHSVAV